MKTISSLVSWFFHPLFLLTYAMILLMLIDPYLFGIQQFSDGIKFVLPVLISTVIIPAFAIMMMKQLGMVKSIELDDKMDRTGPFIVTGIFYLWLFKNLYTNNTLPDLVTCFTLGSTITLFVCFIINIITKISIHAAAVSGVAVMVSIMCFHYFDSGRTINIGQVMLPLPLILFVVVILTGLVGTARLYLRAHSLAQVMSGYIVGLISMLFAVWYIL